MRALGWSIWGLVALAVTLAAALAMLSVWPTHWSRTDLAGSGPVALAAWVLHALLCVPFLFLSALVGLRPLTWFAPAVGLGVTLGHSLAFTGTPWAGAAAALGGALYLARWRRLLPLPGAALGACLLLAWSGATALVLAHAPGAPAAPAFLILVRGGCLSVQGALLAAPVAALCWGRHPLPDTELLPA